MILRLFFMWLEVILDTLLFNGFLICSLFMFVFMSFCSENTKNVLVAACFMHLMHKEHEKFTADLTTINPRILLSGPAGVWVLYYCFPSFSVSICSLNCQFCLVAGSEIYQEMLVKALAKYFGAKLLIFDSHLLLGVR